MKEDICNILQCAGLIHDIGNPPFGHFGEDAIRDWFRRKLPVMEYNGETIDRVLTMQMREDFYHFEGNAQALRLVSKLHFLVDENGMNLTYALLSTIIKYPVASIGINEYSEDIKDKKMGYYYADRDIFEEISRETGTNGKRHPLTFILEAADDIAYKTADIEDAYVKGFLSYHKLLDELTRLEEARPDKDREGCYPARRLQDLFLSGKEKQVEEPEEYAVKNWIVRVQGFLIGCATHGFTENYPSIMEGSYGKDLFYGTSAEPLMDLLGNLAFREVFTSDAIYRMEVAEGAMIDFLMDMFMNAVVKYDDESLEMDSVSERMVSFISSNYKRAYHYHARGRSKAERLYLRLLLATDYICGMTDSYAKRLYQELKAIL